MSDPWAEFEEVQEPQGVPQPIYTAPDPDAARERVRQDAIDARTERKEQRDVDKGAFERVGSLRTEFLGLPDVKAFREVQTSTRQIQRLAEGEGTAMGDLGLIFSYMKTMDPGSTVREGEFATAQNATGIPGAIRNAYNQMVSGERLSPEQRKDMADTATTLLNSRAESYNDIARTYQGLFEAEGADPVANGVVLFEAPESANKPSGDASKIASTQDAIRSGSAELEFGMDQWGKNDVFDRLEYLQDNFGIGADEEARLVASLNEYRGKDVGIGKLAAIYAGLGMEPPTDDVLAQTAQQLKEGTQFGGFDTTAPEQQYLNGLREFREMRGDGRNDEAFMVEQGATLGLSDEIYGAQEAVTALANGRNPIEGYQVGRDADRLAQQEARERLGWKGTALEIGAGLTTGGLRIVPQLAKAGAKAAPTAINEARAAGALAGYGYGEGAGGSAAGAVVGGATGDLVARGIGKVAEKLKNRNVTPEQQAGREVIEAADRTNARTGSNIEPLPADVGGANVRRATSGAAQTTFGASDIVRGGQKVTDEAQGAVETLASREGQIGTRQATGEKAIQGAEKTMKSLKNKVDILYTRARKQAGDTRVELPTAQQVIRDHIGELAETPGGEGVDLFQKMLRETGGMFKVDGVKRMRTTLRDKFMSDNLRGTDLERRMREVIDAAELDIEQGLVAAGKAGAAKTYKAAAKAHAERVSLIDDVIAPIIGKKGDRSGEGAYAAIDRLSRGDAVALGKFMKAMPAEEAGAVRATIIARLGRAPKGRQDADGEAFSLSDFASNWNDEGLSKEAKSALFSGELRAALDDVARVAQGSKEAMRYANHSNTSGGNFFNMLINGAPLGAAFYDLGTAAAAGGGAVLAQKISGKMLSSPGFARWLARAGKIEKPGAARAHTQGLSKIAAKDAAVSAEIIDFQSALLQQLEGAPSRIAAEEDQSSAQAGAATEPPRASQ